MTSNQINRLRSKVSDALLRKNEQSQSLAADYKVEYELD